MSELFKRSDSNNNYNNKPDIIIRHNEKGICMLIDIAKFGRRKCDQGSSREDSKIQRL
jgi:hypothetical protein